MPTITLVKNVVSLNHVFHVLKKAKLLLGVALLCASMDAYSQSYSLKPNSWESLVVPANPNGQTVRQLFGDNMGDLEFGEQWVVFTYDSSAGQYNKPADIDTVLAAGQAFWIVQIGDSVVDLDFPTNLPTVERQYSTSCGGSYGCFIVPLPDSLSNVTQYQLLGAPFSTPLNIENLRFTTNSGASACSSGCTLDAASSASFSDNFLWVYNSTNESYDQPGMGSSLAPWQGFWVTRKPAAFNTQPQLEFPFNSAEEPQAVALNIDDVPDSSVITRKILLSADLIMNNDVIENVPNVSWSVNPPQLAEFIGDSELRIIDDGVLEITAQYEDLTATKEMTVVAYEDSPVPPALSSAMENSIALMDVLILSFLPTEDGVNLDTKLAPGFFDLGESTLTDMQQRIAEFNLAGKFMLEEGSKFRGYKQNNAPPYLGYQVRRHITVYEQIPADPMHVIGQNNLEPDNPDAGTFPSYQPYYQSVFDRLDLVSYIKQNGIDEVWLWYAEPAKPGWPSFDPTIHSVTKPHVGFVESNMASPTTSDISNSYRFQNDLPIVDHTYIVYANNFRRTQNEMVHNHGHQLEAIYKYVAAQQDGNENLFVANFSGWGVGYSSPPLGRSGDTHHPPNTPTDYDYNNTTLVESDIEDWTPNGSGAKKMVNRETWASIPYAWPASMQGTNLGEPAWYVYWMQNMPGYQNQIPYNIGTGRMTNWWEFTADWDAAISSNKGLWQNN